MGYSGRNRNPHELDEKRQVRSRGLGEEDAYELRLQLALSGRQSPSAVQNSPAVGGRRTTSFSGADLRPAFRMEDPIRRLVENEPTESHLALPGPEH